MGAGKVLKYAVLPGFLPRVKEFTASGFSHIALFMACVYRQARLLPANHPYLNPVNTGRFGIRHVLAEARRNLVFSKANIDQIIIYYTLLAGMAALFLQFLLFAFVIVINTAHAGLLGSTWSDFFVRDDVDNDIAFMLMDSVFGFEGIYESCISTGAECLSLGDDLPFPMPMHTALHIFFNFYNLGVLAIGLIVSLYLVATVVGETAQSGQPFGRRFNHAWVPVRIVLALGLLTPLTFGMNGAQLITLFVAKWGSNFASNSWDLFNDTLLDADSALLGTPESLVVRPNAPEFNNILEMMFLARTCKVLTEFSYSNRVIEAYQIHGNTNSWPMPGTYVEAGTNVMNVVTGGGPSIEKNFDITIRFGEYHEDYDSEAGNVKPTCGEIKLKVTSIDDPAALIIQDGYYRIMNSLWNDGPTIMYAENIARKYGFDPENREPNAPMPTPGYIEATKVFFYDQVIAAAEDGRDEQVNNTRWMEDLKERGWGGAAIWYNRIAELNGRLVIATHNLPGVSLYPAIMETVRKEKQKKDKFFSGPDRYGPYTADGTPVIPEDTADFEIAKTLYAAQGFWQNSFVQPTGVTVLDAVTAVFGLNGLFDMVENADVHPLAQLTGIGASLMTSSINNLGYSFGSGLMGGVANILQEKNVASSFATLSSFLMQIALISLSLGFMLYFVIPFLPFIYFFFAVCGWVKSLFEAMVGLPLWALAHIRIDGEGIPGRAAMGGYYLIFEIFLRPVLAVFGLISGLAIFGAMVQVLNIIWNVVLVNVTGTSDAADNGEVIDTASKLFYTILYAIVVYMIGMSSFKLIDLIPQNILRWMSPPPNASPFGEHLGDPAESMLNYTYMGSSMVRSKISSGMSGLLRRIGGGGGEQ